MRTAVLAAIRLRTIRSFENRMEECRRLCEACGIEIVSEIVQNSRTADPHTAFRSGKVEEISAAVKMLEADCVVVFNQLSVAASARLAEAFGVPVMDRTALILDIFSLRAGSAQAKMQVELARLEYAMPALIRNQDEEESHERGGGTVNRGAGEMRAAGLRRRYQRRINDLKKQLKTIEVQNAHAKKHRNKSGLRRAAIVGYTNAGKSSLMNALLQVTESTAGRVNEKDMLFATLDTSIRRIDYAGRAFYLYDTVGFVSDLPHELVEAFRSTLSAAADADLLIEVVDVSDPEWPVHTEVTEETLKQIGAGEIEILRVFNKADRYEGERDPDALYISCRTGEGIAELARTITERLYPEEIRMYCLVPYDRMAMIADNVSLDIRVIESFEDGMMTEVCGERVRALPFMKYRIEEEEYENRMGKNE